MRYVIATLVVLALVSRAMTVCVSSGEELEVRSDCYLGQSSDPYSVLDCTEFLWTFEFDRTPDTSRGNVLMCFSIDSTNVFECYNSSDFDSGHYEFSDTGYVDQGAATNRLRIYRNCIACGKFIDMELKAYSYTQ